MLSLIKFPLNIQFFAQKKAGGAASTNRNHDSHSKRLGVKKFDGEIIKSGGIIIRQRGTKFKCGNGVFLGKDHTIHAEKSGIVKFKKRGKGMTFVNVLSN